MTRKMLSAHTRMSNGLPTGAKRRPVHGGRQRKPSTTEFSRINGQKLSPESITQLARINGMASMVVTGVFDTEGIDVEVPLCPQ